MTQEQSSRTAMLLGEEAVQKLAESRVAIFGVGGVGGYVAEALARAGVGAAHSVLILVKRRNPYVLSPRAKRNVGNCKRIVQRYNVGCCI